MNLYSPSSRFSLRPSWRVILIYLVIMIGGNYESGISYPECTEKNKNIHLRNEEYFNKILTNFKDRAYVLFGNVV